MNRYILCIDIGNTNTVIGLCEDRKGSSEVFRHWRTVSRRDRTSDELALFIAGFLQSENISKKDITGSIYSSVVPSFNPIVERMLSDHFASSPIGVDCKMNLPFKISYPRPEEIGADRLVNAAAAVELYGSDLIVIDLGTATTFCVIKESSYLGGCIAPGLKVSMDTLAKRTAQLPPIEFKRPASTLATSTVAALQSGFYFGWLGLLKEIISRLKLESGFSAGKVVVTGGLGRMMHEEDPDLFDIIDPHLTLKGLKIIFDKSDLR